MHTDSCIFKTAWEKVHGLKKPLWGAIFFLAIFSGFGVWIFHFATKIVKQSYGLADASNVMHSDPLIPVILLLSIGALHLIYTIFVLLPLRFGFMVIPLRHAVGKEVRPCYIFRFFHWHYIKRFIAIEALVTIFMGIPALIAAALFALPHYFVLPLLFEIGAYVGGTIFSLVTLYLLFCFVFSYLIAIDRDVSAWEAIKLSFKTIHPHWFCVFGTMIVGWLAVILGMLCLLIGLIWAIPFMQSLYVTLYQRFIGIAGEDPITKLEKNPA